jgi:hypothetical protein
VVLFCKECIDDLIKRYSETANLDLGISRAVPRGMLCRVQLHANIFNRTTSSFRSECFFPSTSLSQRLLTVMSSSDYFRPLLQAPVFCRMMLLPPARPQARSFALLAPLPHSRFLSLPRIIQPSFWASMVPKPFKSRSEHAKSPGWNPATPYIILGLLVGSQAIQILWLKQERSHSHRKAEAKIGVLKEVIERVQRGEVVQVEQVLGTGDAESEEQWADGKSDADEAMRLHYLTAADMIQC